MRSAAPTVELVSLLPRALQGNIGAGKSTVLNHLRAAFPAAEVFPEPVHEWADVLPLFYAKPAEWALAFSLRVLLSFAKIKDSAAGGLAIVERSPLANRHVFTQLLYNDNTMNREEWELFKEYSDELGWTPDLLVHVHCPTETCLERVQTRARPGEDAIDIQYLKRIEFQYENMMRYVTCPVVRVDGSGTSPDVAREVEGVIRDFMSGAAPRQEALASA